MRRIFLLPLVASVVASVLPAQTPAVLAALATGTYFPLDVGDRWVYRIDDRAVTASYQTWRVDRTETYGGATYSVIAIEGPGTFYYESWFRAGGSGRVYILSGAGEQLFLDPGDQPASGAQLQVTGHGGGNSAVFGSFTDGLYYVNHLSSMIQETGTLIRGLGLLSSTATMLSGSSGGFTQGRTLVEASLAGGIHLPALSSAVTLGIESLNLDAGGRQVTNCAMPCYFVACGMAPGTDPPGTYKPCVQARVELANWPAGASRSVRLQLLAPDGTAAYDATLVLDASPGRAVTFIQIPLYSAPNVPLAPGAYQLVAKSADGAAQSALAVRIQ
jgi:hypothetical protein